MPTGRLGVSNLPAGGNGTSLYTVPSNTFTVLTLSMCNRSAAIVTARVAICAAATASNPDLSEYIEYEIQIPANGVLERTGIVMAATQVLVVRSSAVDVSAVCYGIETNVA